MAKRRNYTKNRKVMTRKTKSILVTILMIMLISALLLGVNALLNKSDEEGFDKYNVTWKSGGIDDNGVMNNDEKFMYSSAINVDTVLLIRREFASNIAFKVYYYNDEGKLIYQDVNDEGTHDLSYTTDYKKSIDEIDVGEEKVDHARIVIEWLENDDERLSFFERISLMDKIRVYVAHDDNAEE